MKLLTMLMVAIFGSTLYVSAQQPDRIAIEGFLITADSKYEKVFLMGDNI